MSPLVCSPRAKISELETGGKAGFAVTQITNPEYRRILSGSPLLDAVEPEAEPRLLAIGGRLMDRAGFGGLVESGSDRAQGFHGLILFAGADQDQILLLQRMEAGLGAAILGLFAGAAPHAAFG